MPSSCRSKPTPLLLPDPEPPKGCGDKGRRISARSSCDTAVSWKAEGSSRRSLNLETTDSARELDDWSRFGAGNDSGVAGGVTSGSTGCLGCSRRKLKDFSFFFPLEMEMHRNFILVIGIACLDLYDSLSTIEDVHRYLYAKLARQCCLIVDQRDCGDTMRETEWKCLSRTWEGRDMSWPLLHAHDHCSFL
jgi:hypothetical protein